MIEIIPNWHPFFVHFTVALLLVSVVLYLVGWLAKCEQATLVARWNLWLGAGVSLVTLAAGFQAFNTVAHDTPSHLAMIEHRNLALITAVLLLLWCAWSVVLHKKAKAVGGAFVVLALLVGAMVMSTAWHGAELVYRHGLGVMSLPDADAHDHAGHDHGGHAHGDAGHGHGDIGGHDHGDDGHHGHDDLSAEEPMMDEMQINDAVESRPAAVSDHHHGDDHAHSHDHDHKH